MTARFVPSKRNLLFRRLFDLLQLNVTCYSEFDCLFVTSKRNLLFRVRLFVLLQVNITCYKE